MAVTQRRARLITRDIKDFPDRDFKVISIQTELSMHWGDHDVARGYVTVIDFGVVPIDFSGGIALGRAAGKRDRSPSTSDQSPEGGNGAQAHTGAHKKKRRKKKTRRTRGRARSNADGEQPPAGL